MAAKVIPDPANFQYEDANRDNRKTFAFDLLWLYRRNGPNRRREIRAHARGNGALR